jgi:hypothetical protein
MIWLPASLCARSSSAITITICVLFLEYYYCVGETMHSIATRNDAMIYAMVRVQKYIYIYIYGRASLIHTEQQFD